MIKKIVKYIWLALLFIGLTPFRDKQSIALILHQDENWTGNFKSLHEALKKFGYSVYVIDLSLKSSTRDHLTENRVEFKSSLLCREYLLSGFVFTSHGPDLLSLFFCNAFKKLGNLGALRRYRILLWHGVGTKRQANGSWHKFSSYLFEYVLAHDEFDKTRMEEILGLNSERIIITGYPRYEAILCPESALSREELLQKSKVEAVKNEKELILYAPTWDVFTDAPNVLLEKVEAIIKSLAGSDRCQLGLRLHPKSYRLLELTSLPDSVYIFNNIDFPSTEVLLRDVDYLITDFSSIWYDFNALNRPIVLDTQSIDFFIEKERVRSDFYDLFCVVTRQKIISIDCIQEVFSDLHKKNRGLSPTTPNSNIIRFVNSLS
ncbi:hypothetical protein CWE12_08605 [Aliidiomarina sedimenti]|uniref:CDP-glycerol--glycerophosphate glycerophosphotransferase n=1 Tax=Aliidiomarina sedimenti TaxID=1933879 RepID=A0ABY0BZS3_9GAMM|nr:CDP-glycerol glycerophosphotransferase family protein [Aliidiomarina sedimenti]RUO30011.1 hypothetical protein CWE12_08605 [Aliidiomarina sedimenti]